MAIPAGKLPKRVQTLIELSDVVHQHPAGYAIASDSQMVRLNSLTVDHLASSAGSTLSFGDRCANVLAMAAERHGPVVERAFSGLALVAGSAAAAIVFLAQFPAPADGRINTAPFPIAAILAAVMVACIAGWSAVRPQQPNPGGPDSVKLRRIAGRAWVLAPRPNTQEGELAAATALLHDRITASPILEGNLAAETMVDVHDEAMGILSRLHEIEKLRKELGTPDGHTDPIWSQHKLLDQSVLSVARRIEALDAYYDHLVELRQEHLKLAQLERAEQLHDKVLDVVSEDSADPHRSIDSADLRNQINSTRAAIASTTEALALSAAALATKQTPLRELRDRLKE